MQHTKNMAFPAAASWYMLSCLVVTASAFLPPPPPHGFLARSKGYESTNLHPAATGRAMRALPRVGRTLALRMGSEGEGKKWRSQDRGVVERGSWVAEMKHKAAILKSARRAWAAERFSRQGASAGSGTASKEQQNFLRLVRTGDRSFELQTAIVTYRNNSDSAEPRFVDLVSLVHLGDPKYFQELQDFADEGHDRVLFELITDSKLVETDASGQRRLKQRLFPANDQFVLARRHGLQAQLEGLNMTGSKWLLADLDKDTIHRLQQERGEAQTPSLLATLLAGWGSGEIKVLPARIQSFVRSWLRAPIWLVPCPEGAMLMLDWALSEKGRVSDLLGAMLDSLLALDVKTASKLAFAQLLVSGSMRGEGPQTVIIQERNKAALEELAKHSGQHTALIYGSMHGQDLHKRLTQDLNFDKVECTWKTAWRIFLPPRSRDIPAKLGLVVAAYLCIDGVDWINTISATTQEASGGAWDAALALAVAYLLRHGALYWQMGRLLVTWDRSPFEYAASIRTSRPDDGLSSRETSDDQMLVGEEEEEGVEMVQGDAEEEISP